MHLGQIIVQIDREPGQDGGSPAFRVLSRSQDAADLPVKEEHAGVSRHRGAHLGRADALFDIS